MIQPWRRCKTNHLITVARFSEFVLLCSIAPHWQPKTAKSIDEVGLFPHELPPSKDCLLKEVHTLVMMSLNCPSFHASVG